MNIIDLKKKKQEEPEFNLEKEELYNSSFFEYVMNMSKKLTPKQYSCVLSCLSPSLSLKFSERYKSRIPMLVDTYLKIKPEDKQYLSQMPDQGSVVNHIFKHYLLSFQDDLKKFSREETLDRNVDFYFQCEEIYRELPASFVFALIDLIEATK